jgi:MFS family permease
VGLTNGAFWSFAAVYAQRLGFTLTGTASFMSAAVIGGALAQWPLGWASDRVDRRRVMIAAVAGATIFCAGLAFLRALPEDQLLGLVFGFGAFSFPLYALAVAHANDHAAPEDFVETSGGLLLTYAAGAVIGPVVASTVMAVIGVGGLFAYMCVVYVVFAAFVLVRIRQRAAIPAAERENFVPMATATSPEAYQIDPRSEETPVEPAPAEPPKAT